MHGYSNGCNTIRRHCLVLHEVDVRAAVLGRLHAQLEWVFQKKLVEDAQWLAISLPIFAAHAARRRARALPP